jgi:chemotaxis-related protein WspD
MKRNAAPTARPTLDDCWNRIGVRGERSCPELKQHIHCHNCPVHAAAATALLGGALPAEYLAEWTRHVAEPKRVREPDSRSAFLFRLGAEWLALPTATLIEVAEPRPYHSLPHRRSGAVLGLVNIRGELLVCVSLAELLKLEGATPAASDSRRVLPRLLVCELDGCRAVFPVDEAHGVHRYQPHQLLPVPNTLSKAAASYTSALLPWERGRVGCLDEQLLFYTIRRSLA